MICHNPDTFWKSQILRNHRKTIDFSTTLWNSQFSSPTCTWHHLDLRFVPSSFPQSPKVYQKIPMGHPRIVQRLRRSHPKPPRDNHELHKSCIKACEDPRDALQITKKLLRAPPRLRNFLVSKLAFLLNPSSIPNPSSPSSPSILQPSNHHSWGRRNARSD